MTSQLRRLRLGLTMTAGVAAVAALFWGATGAMAAAAFGGVATAIQLLAARWAGLTGRRATPDQLAVYLIGMVLRIAGVALIGVAVTIDRATFPPGPAAVGYLGTLLPLMWLETRLA